MISLLRLVNELGGQVLYPCSVVQLSKVAGANFEAEFLLYDRRTLMESQVGPVLKAFRFSDVLCDSLRSLRCLRPVKLAVVHDFTPVAQKALFDVINAAFAQPQFFGCLPNRQIFNKKKMDH